jgi:O-antigen ligase
MKFYLLLIAAVLMALAWLLPVHYRPWVTYTGELYAFLALMTVSAIYLKQKLIIPKISLPLLALSLVPLIQYGFGQVFFFDKALLCSLFIFGFWLSITLGFNLAYESKQARETLFTNLCYLLTAVGAATAFIAVCQWVNLDAYLPGMHNIKSFGGRPYANFAQPNNMATFLLMALLACWYLYEKQKLDSKVLSFIAALIVTGVVLGQSRTSWVACLCILFYGAYQYYKGVLSLKWYYVTAWSALFVVLLIWALPLSVTILSPFADEAVANAAGAVEISKRATGDMSRLAIWQQMLHAIMEQPLWGYGWHQTSVAYTLISDYFQGPVWIRSAHNFILDFLIWNGLVIGLPFLAYFAYWGLQLLRRVNSVESVIALLMITVFVVHAMLEFPQNYAYFLLPIGFILGILQAQAATKSLSFSPRFMQVTLVLGVAITALIYRDYETVVPKLNQSMRYEKTPEKITNDDQVYLLEEFNRRIEWIRMNPYTELQKDDITKISEIILNYPTTYDLFKYAKLLAFNGYEEEAKHQLWLLRELRDLDISYAELIELQPQP